VNMKSKTEEIYKGIPASKGISMGKPFVYRAEMPSYNHYSGIDIVIEKEILDYDDAISKSKKELDKILILANEKLEDKNIQIFDAQISFINDDILHEKVKNRIKNENKSAYQIFNEEIKNIEDALLASKDEYMRERISDIEDIKNRVLRNIFKGRLISKILSCFPTVICWVLQPILAALTRMYQ